MVVELFIMIVDFIVEISVVAAICFVLGCCCFVVVVLLVVNNSLVVVVLNLSCNCFIASENSWVAQVVVVTGFLVILGSSLGYPIEPHLCRGHVTLQRVKYFCERLLIFIPKD